MTQDFNTACTTEESKRLDAQISCGRPLSLKALAYHLTVDEDKAREVVKKTKLEREGRTFPWRRIWRAIHGTEGARLGNHLASLKESHPESPILGKITDLAFELRAPLISFAELADLRGKQPDTLAKALRQGRETLPYPILHFGPRTRLFRRLEVRLWENEGIILNLPKPLITHTSVPPRTTGSAAQVTQDKPDFSSPELRKKAIFGARAGDSQTSAR